LRKAQEKALVRLLIFIVFHHVFDKKQLVPTISGSLAVNLESW